MPADRPPSAHVIPEQFGHERVLGVPTGLSGLVATRSLEITVCLLEGHWEYHCDAWQERDSADGEFRFRETVRRNSICRSAMSGSERCATEHAGPRASIRACRWSVTRDHISSRQLVSHEKDLTDPHRLSHTTIAKALRMLFGNRSNFWTEGRPSPELRVVKGNSCLRQELQTDPQSMLGTASTGRTARGLILPTSLLPRLRRPSPLCVHVDRMPPRPSSSPPAVYLALREVSNQMPPNLIGG